MLEDDSRQINYQDYTATSLGMIGKMLGQDKWTLPSFVEMMYPEKAKKDMRTGKEIVNDILERLS